MSSSWLSERATAFVRCPEPLYDDDEGNFLPVVAKARVLFSHLGRSLVSGVS